MRILIVGSELPYTLECSYKRAMSQLGHDVITWNPAAAIQKHTRLGKFGRTFQQFVHVEAWARKAGTDLLRTACEYKPGVVIVIATHGVRAGTLCQLKAEYSCELVCIFPDSPHNLDSERIACLPVFDRFYTSSPAWVDSFKLLGARASYLPFAADTLFHRPTESSLKHDLAFVGNWRREREDNLEALAEFDLHIWGESYWKDRTRKNSPLRARWGGRSLFGEDLARASAEYKIMLNLYDVATRPGPNMRAFELPACGAFTLSERTAAALDVFTEGETAEYFSSPEEAKDKIRFYLKNSDARERIGRKAYEFVISAGHTYFDRAKQVLA